MQAVGNVGGSQLFGIEVHEIRGVTTIEAEEAAASSLASTNLLNSSSKKPTC